MPQSFAQIYLHIVFSTKNRTPWLDDENLRSRLHGYLAGPCRNLDSPSQIIGGTEDHLHILCRFSRTLTVADLVRTKTIIASKCSASQIRVKASSLCIPLTGQKRCDECRL